MIKAITHDGKGSKSKADIKRRERHPSGAVMSSARVHFQVLSEWSSEQAEILTQLLFVSFLACK